MRKAGLTIFVIAVAAGVGAGLWVWKGTEASGLAPAAELVPAETVLLAELPDLAGSQVRWRETAIWKIMHEPEVAAFLERPLSKIPKGKTGKADETLGHLRKVEPRRAFLALAGIEKNNPRLVGGFSFAGPKSDVEALIAKAKASAQKASPGGKAALTKYNDFEIESFSDNDVTVAGAFAGNAYFVSNDVELLKATLDRFSQKNAAGSLAETELYKKSLAPLPPNPDLLLFAQPALFFDRIMALSAVAGQPVNPQQAEELRKIQAISAATRMEGERMRDVLFVLRPEGEALPSLSRSTLALTSANTLLYYAFAPVLPEKFEMPETGGGLEDADADPTGLLSALAVLRAQLKAQGVEAGDLKAAFGPEVGVISDWPAAAVQPTFAVAAEVRDAALARKFAEALGASWTRQEGEGATYWTAPPGTFGNLIPAAAVTDKYLLLGASLDAVQAAVIKAAGKDDKTLESAPAFAGALATVPKPGNTMAYVDSKALFERIYGTVRPMAMLWAGLIPYASEYVDITKLPLTETISKHLQPTVFSSSAQKEGILFESTGTVTFNQGGLALGVLGGAAAVPIIQGKIPLPGLGSPRPRPQRPLPPKTPPADDSPAPEAAEPSAAPDAAKPVSAAVQ